MAGKKKDASAKGKPPWLKEKGKPAKGDPKKKGGKK